PVSERMTEVLTEAGVRDHVPAHRVQLRTVDPGTDRLDTGVLGPQYHLVRLEETIGRGTERDGPGAVGGVAVDGGTEVHHHEIPGGQDTVPGDMVGERAMESRGHD